MTTIAHSTGVITPTIVDGYRAARTPRTILHPILGRADDDVTFRPASLRKGTLSLVFATEAAANSAAAALAIPQVLTLADPDITIGMTFVVSDEDTEIELDDETRDAWILTVPFREIAP
jgi:hypothetical protein